MKKIFTGTVFLFFGLTLYVVSHIQAVKYLPNVSGWPTNKSKFWVALDQTHGLTPTYFGITFCVVGIFFVLWGCFEDDFKKFLNNRKKLSGKQN